MQSEFKYWILKRGTYSCLWLYTGLRKCKQIGDSAWGLCPQVLDHYWKRSASMNGLLLTPKGILASDEVKSAPWEESPAPLCCSCNTFLTQRRSMLITVCWLLTSGTCIWLGSLSFALLPISNLLFPQSSLSLLSLNFILVCSQIDGFFKVSLNFLFLWVLFPRFCYVCPFSNVWTFDWVSKYSEMHIIL